MSSGLLIRSLLGGAQGGLASAKRDVNERIEAKKQEALEKKKLNLWKWKQNYKTDDELQAEKTSKKDMGAMRKLLQAEEGTPEYDELFSQLSDKSAVGLLSKKKEPEKGKPVFALNRKTGAAIMVPPGGKLPKGYTQVTEDVYESYAKRRDPEDNSGDEGIKLTDQNRLDEYATRIFGLDEDDWKGIDAIHETGRPPGEDRIRSYNNYRKKAGLPTVKINVIDDGVGWGKAKWKLETNNGNVKAEKPNAGNKREPNTENKEKTDNKKPSQEKFGSVQEATTAFQKAVETGDKEIITNIAKKIRFENPEAWEIIKKQVQGKPASPQETGNSMFQLNGEG